MIYLRSPRLIRLYRGLKKQIPWITSRINKSVIRTNHQVLSREMNIVNIFDIASERLSNVKLFGKTRIIELDEQNASLFIPRTDLPLQTLLNQYLVQEEVLQLLKFDLEKDNIYTKPAVSGMKIFGNWITLLDPSANNWMHFISEVLPNAIESTKHLEEDLFGIVVDNSLSKSSYELIRIIFPGVPTVIIEENQPIEVETLITGDINKKSASYFWPRQKQKTLGSYSFSTEYLIECRDLITKNLKMEVPTDEMMIRLYVKRKSYFRRVVNHDFIEHYLRKNGFLVIEPSESNLLEQIELFSKAKVVVAQAGAALANIIFMQPGSSVYSLMADSEWIDYEYFAKYSSIFEVNFIPVLGKIVGEKKLIEEGIGTVLHPMNADFNIDPHDLIAAVEG
jgi:Glycosyltransferase 61